MAVQRVVPGRLFTGACVDCLSACVGRVDGHGIDGQVGQRVRMRGPAGVGANAAPDSTLGGPDKNCAPISAASQAMDRIRPLSALDPLMGDGPIDVKLHQ